MFSFLDCYLSCFPCTQFTQVYAWFCAHVKPCLYTCQSCHCFTYIFHPSNECLWVFCFVWVFEIFRSPFLFCFIKFTLIFTIFLFALTYVIWFSFSSIFLWADCVTVPHRNLKTFRESINNRSSKWFYSDLPWWTLMIERQLHHPHPTPAWWWLWTVMFLEFSSLLST